jgi:hypothetical protein
MVMMWNTSFSFYYLHTFHTHIYTMPVTQYETLVSQLDSTLPEERAKILRTLKNSVIGNRQKKDHLAKLGIVSSLVRLIQQPNAEPEDYILACNILGSLSYGR